MMGTIEIVNTGQMAIDTYAQGDTRPHVLEHGQKRIVDSVGSLRIEITALPDRRRPAISDDTDVSRSRK